MLTPSLSFILCTLAHTLASHLSHHTTPHQNHPSNPPQTGRGIFAKTPIPKDTIIETSPVLVFTPLEVENHTTHTSLAHYTYYWPSPTGSGPQSQAIALGLGSMFNHSGVRQNVVWRRDVERGVIVYSACRDIEVGEELCISYGNARLWFQDVEAEVEDGEQVHGEGDELSRSGLGAIAVLDEEER